MKAASVATVAAPVSIKSPLWKWTGISAAGHAIFLAVLCLISHQLEKQKQAKLKAEAEQKAVAAAAAEKAAAEKAAADKAAAEKKKAASPESPKTAASGPATGTTNDVKTAEKILGIDKVASPDELKKGLKSKDDDLLKDLK
ncbi:hypothetical protein LBMAG56_04820 [Verrucomicrobiota bacterium]|nr:hypothetical protein LBMAG56_04820 [Verrucomicrobiota bacterium]